MSCLNRDVLFQIFEELNNDKKSLHSCLLVNSIWCKTAVPILWKNPGRYYITIITDDCSMSKLFAVILLNLSEESKNILKDKGIKNPLAKTYPGPSFNYVNFWRYLNLFFIERMIASKKIEMANKSIIRDEILKLFINKNTRFTHLSIPRNFDYQLHHISGIECCISELESFDCINQNDLEGLARICKSIKKLLVRNYASNPGIFKLIEVQKKLVDVTFTNSTYDRNDESFNKSLEESLIKHADTIRYFRIDWRPVSKILSYLVNLISLEINIPYFMKWDELFYVEDVSLPALKILRTQRVPSNILANLIKSTKGHLSEISILYNDFDNERFIQAIYQNCPNLKYLKLSLIANANLLISEFENLLNNCQSLNGLIIDLSTSNYDNVFNWIELFEILTRSSPISLFKFKFIFRKTMIKLEHLKLFFDNWKDRNPILLKIKIIDYSIITLEKIQEQQQLEDLVKKYMAKGIVKQYSIITGWNIYEDFEWT